jgi:hypothetical protein
MCPEDGSSRFLLSFAHIPEDRNLEILVFQMKVRRIFGNKKAAERWTYRKSRDGNMYIFISKDIE